MVESDVMNVLNIARDLKSRREEDTDFIVQSLVISFSIATVLVGVILLAVGG